MSPAWRPPTSRKVGAKAFIEALRIRLSHAVVRAIEHRPLKAASATTSSALCRLLAASPSPIKAGSTCPARKPALKPGAPTRRDLENACHTSKRALAWRLPVQFSLVSHFEPLAHHLTGCGWGGVFSITTFRGRPTARFDKVASRGGVASIGGAGATTIRARSATR